jgi:hypothetical protein
MLKFQTISKIFSDFLDGILPILKSENQLNQLIRLNIEINRKLWDLEDSARMIELGSGHVAKAKQEIDKNNQIRNDLIREIDIMIVDQMSISPGSKEQFYSESPGMIIDRLAILFIKLSVISDLLLIIKEDNLQKEYEEKEKILLKQVDFIGGFLDSYFTKLARKEIFFKIQQPVKIYNDNRIKEYIKIINNK